MIKNIAFTVYAVTDIPKARAFYEGVLGLTASDEFGGGDNPSWIEYNIGEGTFSIGCSPDWKPSEDGATLALEVDDFAEFTAGLKEKGVVFKMEPMEFPTCHMAVIKDPDLNNLIIHKRK